MTQTIIFSTPTILDINAAIILGVSVKKNSNPIGYFGTGLKFAIATLLRTNHAIFIQAGPDNYEFGIDKKNIRGEGFDIVCMKKNDEPIQSLGFTTQLGKNWNVEMAYRELHSNTMDENGKIHEADNFYSPHWTNIKVIGPEISKAYSLRHKLFLHPDGVPSRPPIHSNSLGEIYSGPSHFIYYRGVIGLPLKEPLTFTPNITARIELSEDRFIKDTYTAQFYIANLLADCPSPSLFHDIFDNWETSGNKQNLGIYLRSVVSNQNSTVAQVLAARISQNRQVPEGTQSLLQSLGYDTLESNQIQMTELQHKYISRAILLLEEMKLIQPKIFPPIRIAELPLNQMAIAQLNTKLIYLSPKVFELGVKFTASTLYEEYLHIVRGLSDESRSMQNHLLDTIFTVWENCKGEII